MPRRPAELTVVLLVAAVQFVNILDFMIIMPLGPDFARALGIPASNLGFIGGAYTAAAAVSGLIGALFLDRLDRRVALGWAMTGLVLGTAAGGFATGLPTLMLARVVAGIFGGPATSVSFSIIADIIPPERRGKAMGIVMGAFSVASVLGVPAGLELARLWGWRAPFFAVAGMGAVVVTVVIFSLPSLTGHIAAAAGHARTSIAGLARRRLVLLSWSTTALVMTAGFILIPNIAAYLLFNVGYPRERLGLLYMAGGVVSFFTTQAGGRVVDKFGSFRTAVVGCSLLVVLQWACFVTFPPLLHPIPLFMTFMLAMGLRNVSYNTLCSRVPEPHERARFMSIQSSVQHAASAAGAFLSAQILSETLDHKLVHMPVVSGISIALTVLAPAIMFVVERGVRAKEALAKAA